MLHKLASNYIDTICDIVIPATEKNKAKQMDEGDQGVCVGERGCYYFM